MSINNDLKIAAAFTPSPDVPETSHTIESVKDRDQVVPDHKDNLQTMDLRPPGAAQAVSPRVPGVGISASESCAFICMASVSGRKPPGSICRGKIRQPHKSNCAREKCKR